DAGGHRSLPPPERRHPAQLPAVLMRRSPRWAAGALLGFVGALLAAPQALHAQTLTVTADRPFGTLREQAAIQQQWLEQRLERFLPALMRKHGVDLWVISMREYNEDPVFSAIVSPTTFAA